MSDLGRSFVQGAYSDRDEDDVSDAVRALPLAIAISLFLWLIVGLVAFKLIF